MIALALSISTDAAAGSDQTAEGFFTFECQATEACQLQSCFKVMQKMTDKEAFRNWTEDYVLSIHKDIHEATTRLDTLSFKQVVTFQSRVSISRKIETSLAMIF